jgi:hypothetical protein
MLAVATSVVRDERRGATMRKVLIGATAVAAATVVGGSLATTMAASSEDGDVRTITVLDRTTDEQDLDLDHSGGFGPGDVNIFTSDELNGAGRKVGVGNGTITVAYGHVLIEGTVTLAGRGQITFAGADDLDAESGRLAVTGGTEEFRGVRGEVRFETLDGTDTRLRFRLVR